MRRVYLSFLGKGSFSEKLGRHEYKPAQYELNGRRSSLTEFVQVAEIEILGADSFDLLIIVATEVSRKANYDKLRSQLEGIGVRHISPIILGEEMSAEGQWQWFEQILCRIEHRDVLTIDLTHGYRSVPIVFSTAINFLQKARSVSISAVYYGVYEKEKELGYAPIIDMKDFYIVNEWAEAVSRLVEDADARKMAEVTAEAPGFQTGGLNDSEIIEALDLLTNTIRNVEINKVAERARRAIDLVQRRQSRASDTGKILMGLVLDKFSLLALETPQSGRYDKQYFELQLEITKLLLEHKLFMQAFTVMREFIGSLGLIGMEGANFINKPGRNVRYQFSDVFINMLQHDEGRWKFTGEKLDSHKKLMPYYSRLKMIGVEALLRSFTSDLLKYRNGFDHAWTLKAEAPRDIETRGFEMVGKLKQTVELMRGNGILN